MLLTDKSNLKPMPGHLPFSIPTDPSFEHVSQINRRQTTQAFPKQIPKKKSKGQNDIEKDGPYPKYKQSQNHQAVGDSDFNIPQIYFKSSDNSKIDPKQKQMQRQTSIEKMNKKFLQTQIVQGRQPAFSGLNSFNNSLRSDDPFG